MDVSFSEMGREAAESAVTGLVLRARITWKILRINTGSEGEAVRGNHCSLWCHITRQSEHMSVLHAGQLDLTLEQPSRSFVTVMNVEHCAGDIVKRQAGRNIAALHRKFLTSWTGQNT
jgi:hypothetical protein